MAPRSLRDLLIIGGVLVALFALSAALGVLEHLSDWLLTREQRGGVFALLSLLAVGAAVFSALRWRQAAVETRKRVEAERRYRLLVEQAPVVIYARDTTRPTGEVSSLFVSPQIEALLGYSIDEWTADHTLRIERIHPNDREEWLRAPMRQNGAAAGSIWNTERSTATDASCGSTTKPAR